MSAVKGRSYVGLAIALGSLAAAISFFALALSGWISGQSLKLVGDLAPLPMASNILLPFASRFAVHCACLVAGAHVVAVGLWLKRQFEFSLFLSYQLLFLLVGAFTTLAIVGANLVVFSVMGAF